MKIKLSWRLWVLTIVLVLSLLSIIGSPGILFKKGVLITSVEQNSTAYEEGLVQGQIITEIDGMKIDNLEDYSSAFQEKFISGQKVKTTIQTESGEIILFDNAFPKITVSEIPKTKIKLGLDLAGGARALIKAQDIQLSSKDTEDLAKIIENRLNVYGIEDVKIVAISDLSGENYIKIEIAGATPGDLRNLISEQGKFEAKIGDEIVFRGGDKDITSVARSGQDAIIESCQQSGDSYFCNFRFAIFLSEEAATRHAEITKGLDVNATSDGNYLSKKLDLFLDDNLVDSLLISEGLKGRVTTQISISGSATGETREDAYDNANQEMNHLQTILITGSLPYKLEIVKLDTLSPTLGKEFLSTILLAGLAAFLAISVIVFFRYRRIKSSLALVLISISEVIIILGIAALIDWNIDLPSIAGIIATIGTGIDQQIIILDEARQRISLSLKQKLKRALSIILGAYFTVVVSMIPLYWAAAGFFKGFAVTTIIGITAGILITRPAFSDIIGKIEE
ncbi:MAG: hypothetical protein ABIH49_03355 [archaeon]